MFVRKPKGTQDLLPGTIAVWQQLEEVAKDVCRRFHYEEIRTPIFEQTELFQRGVGETTDVVEKEMYTFLDKGDRSMTLRPEGTAGVVRAYVENKLYAEAELNKLFYFGPMFRYERPQAGRYRQFHQFGAEAIGSEDPSIDAEVIALGYLFLQELGISNVTVELNSVGTPEIREAFRTQLRAFLDPIRESLCNDCQSRIERNPLRVLDCKKDQELFTDAPSILDALDEACSDHFNQVQNYLTRMNIPFTINPKMVRGLDYYTHTAFEYKAEGIGAIDTIGGGGRYNGLVSQLGGQDQPGVGLAFGLERVLLIMEHQKVKIKKRRPVDVYLVALGDVRDEVTSLVYDLRKAGITAEKDYLGRKMKGQMRAADRSEALFVAILGEDELQKGEISVKHMESGEQQAIALSEFVPYIQEKL